MLLSRKRVDFTVFIIIMLLLLLVLIVIIEGSYHPRLRYVFHHRGKRSGSSSSGDVPPHKLVRRDNEDENEGDEEDDDDESSLSSSPDQKIPVSPHSPSVDDNENEDDNSVENSTLILENHDDKSSLDDSADEMKKGRAQSQQGDDDTTGDDDSAAEEGEEEEGTMSRSELEETQRKELETSQRKMINHDPAQFYRAPGGYCNKSYIEKRLLVAKEHGKKMNFNLTGNLTILDLYHLERAKCLFYTKTYCALVDVKKKEYRCICNDGRTWEDGSCLAFHGQPCTWDNDCVRNAKCLFESDRKRIAEEQREAKIRKEEERKEYQKKVAILKLKLAGKWIEKPKNYDDDADADADGEEEDEDDEKDEEDKENDTNSNTTITEEEETTEYHPTFEWGTCEWGTCECHPFKKCQRTSKRPPFRDGNFASPRLSKISSSLKFFILLNSMSLLLL